MDSYIPAIYEKVKREVMADVEQRELMGAMAGDGWSKKAAAQGTPIINVVLNPPDARSVFIKVGWEPNSHAADLNLQNEQHKKLADLGCRNCIAGKFVHNTAFGCVQCADLLDQPHSTDSEAVPMPCADTVNLGSSMNHAAPSICK
jgi:hypothetical protein